MKIGIDTDGVLTDIYTFNYLRGKEHFKKEPEHPEKFGGHEMFDFKVRNELIFCASTFLAYSKHCPPREHCVDTIQNLVDLGHELYEITARLFSTQKTPLGWYSRRILLKWYKKHNLKFDEVVFCSTKHDIQEKLDACNRLGVDLMIDDKPEVAKYLSENGIRVLLFDAPYNQGVIGKNIERIYSWEDVPKFIEKPTEA